MISTGYQQDIKMLTGIALVVYPLNNLIQDQLKNLDRMGIKGLWLKPGESSEALKQIETEDYSVLLVTPETALAEETVDLIEEIESRVCVLAIDEAHCIVDWGDTFREAYKKLGSLRTRLTCPVAFFTATSSDSIIQSCQDSLFINDSVFITHVSNRPNIKYHVHTTKAKFENLDEMAEELKGQEKSFPKTVIFCREKSTIREMYKYFGLKLGRKLWQYGAAPGTCLVEMFSADADLKTKRLLPAQFNKPDSTMRVLITTIAFGMGVDIPDIRTVIHWGLPNSVLAYAQETGRAGRDGEPSKAILYNPGGRGKSDKLMLEISHAKACVRYLVLKGLKVQGVSEADIQGAIGGEWCCSFCDNKS